MKLTGRRIAILATDDGEHGVLIALRTALENAGATCLLVFPARAVVGTDRHLDMVDSMTADGTLDDVGAETFDGLLLPGIAANPDMSRNEPAALAFVRAFVDGAKPVAAICDAAGLLVEADRVADRTLTSWPSLRRDIVTAGGTWSDEPVVRDGQLLTGQGPDDLPHFVPAAIDLFASAPSVDAALDAALDDSFPASDPPSMTTGPRIQ